MDIPMWFGMIQRGASEASSWMSGQQHVAFCLNPTRQKIMVKLAWWNLQLARSKPTSECCLHNHLDRVGGCAPSQWAYGDTPILEPAEVTDLLSLMYTQIFLAEMARPIEQTAKKPRVNRHNYIDEHLSRPRAENSPTPCCMRWAVPGPNRYFSPS